MKICSDSIRPIGHVHFHLLFSAKIACSYVMCLEMLLFQLSTKWDRIIAQICQGCRSLQSTPLSIIIQPTSKHSRETRQKDHFHLAAMETRLLRLSLGQLGWASSHLGFCFYQASHKSWEGSLKHLTYWWGPFLLVSLHLNTFSNCLIQPPV